MDVFDYLEMDGERLVKGMQQLCDNYARWTMDRVFEESKKRMDSVSNFIHKKQNIVAYTFHKRDQTMDDLIARLEDKKLAIDDVIESLTQIHVDEPGFEQLFERLTKKFEDFVRFCEDELYPAIKTACTVDELERMNHQIEPMIFS